MSIVRWTKELVIADAQKYSCMSDWSANSSACDTAYKMGWTKEAAAHMIPRWSKKWDKETVLEDARRFTSRKEWQRKSNSAYKAAWTHGWLEDACVHMIRPEVHNKEYTAESVLISARKYKTFKEWYSADRGSYKAAHRFGVLKEAKMHFTKTKRSWENASKKDIVQIARQFETVSDWQQSSFARAYHIARKNDWLEDCCGHMKPWVSKPEVFIREYVQRKFPTAVKRKFGKRVWGKSGTCFELDVYVPELNCGIEFNGDYWHGKGFRAKPFAQTPEEYHIAKHLFFADLGIPYLEIWESEWTTNRHNCLQKINDFLLRNN